jgi:hypothetical protein
MKRRITSLCFIIAFINCLIGCGYNSNGLSNESLDTSNYQIKESDNVNESIAVTETDNVNESNLVTENVLTDYFDQDMCDNIMDILENELKFEGIYFVGKDDLLANYYFKIDDYSITVCAYDDDGVYNVYLKNNMDYTFYTIDDGVIMTYEDFTDKIISGEDMAYYYSMVQETVESALVNPSSAKFQNSSDIYYQKKGNIIAMKGTVTAKNRMNEKITSEFVVEIIVYDKYSFNYDVLYLKLDGESSGEWVSLD